MWAASPHHYQSSKSGFNRPLGRLDLCPVELDGYNESMSDSSLRNLKGKGWLERPLSAAQRYLVSHGRLANRSDVGHARQSWPRIVLDPSRKAVLKDKKVSEERG